MESSDNASSTHYQVIVVGAGAAGIGIGAALKDFGVENFIILEKDSIGASFKRWPKETKLLTPSFQSTQFGLLDLNAIALNTSPALSSGLEHMDGAAYASYLENVTKEFALTVKTNQKIKGVNHTANMFQVSSGKKSYSCTYLIWATGEFQYPQLMPFKGAQHALHTAKVKSYHKLPGTEYIIIGG